MEPAGHGSGRARERRPPVYNPLFKLRVFMAGAVMARRAIERRETWPT